MQILSSNLNFYSKKTFKRMFETCAYSGEKFEQCDVATIEHIIPVNCGGKNDASNYLVVKSTWNAQRSDIPLDVFIKENPQVKENIIKTVKSKEGQTIEGINWAREVKKSLKKAIGYDIFE